MKEKIEQVNQILESKGVTIESIFLKQDIEDVGEEDGWVVNRATRDFTLTVKFSVSDD